MGIAVFASGNGSNFQSLIDCSNKENWEVPISLLICDRPNAKAIERAQAAKVPYRCINPHDFADKVRYEQEIVNTLEEYQIKWIVLAGYMRIIGETILNPFIGKIVNIHPSLLPAFPGKHAIEEAFTYPVKITGVTIHFIDEGIDTGPIIAQEAVSVDPDDTLASLEDKIHRVEHRLYPKIVRSWVEGKL
ncbi:formyltetrahydrofolate-dependent phosphoribosylglycinamide formyltransferase [Seinonella peptonophila]|uniref:Phosphoribosylglycinamide formyltransferase n=1 Tax=Seinonella peptonophila TaxID=112248 RepID=A0A1M4ZHB2_9BACL|nr:phosphoribosylglycinamide formyltransferase [Seinonella peptonophila]SHF17391.1 formyltetrahydrofolate-dependent phosphoribosylglycinamide formyltransferase [Seinonella peptonophila]